MNSPNPYLLNPNVLEIARKEANNPRNYAIRHPLTQRLLWFKYNDPSLQVGDEIPVTDGFVAGHRNLEQATLIDYYLQSIFQTLNLVSDSERIDYLSSLKESTIYLRNSYKNTNVDIRYDDKRVQGSYLLNYAPHYANVLTTILNAHRDILYDNFHGEKFYDCPDRINLRLYGSGPCPEIIGVLESSLLHETYSEKFNPKLTFQSFDIAAYSWHWSRDFITRGVVNLKKSYDKFNLDFLPACEWNLCTNNLFPDKSPCVSIFQNCLNEFIHIDPAHFIESFVNIFATLDTGNTIIFVDLSGYKEIINVILEIERRVDAQTKFSVKKSVKDQPAAFRCSEPPEIIKKHLLTSESGLIPRRNINFNYSIIKKDNEVGEGDNLPF